MIKLIAIDMDGTLLKENKTISSNTLKSIKAAQEKGVKIVLATGRPLKGIKPYLDFLKINGKNDFAITCNGAMVQNIFTENVVAKQFMTIDDLLYLYELSKKLGVYIHAFVEGSCISPNENPYANLEHSFNNIPIEIIDFYKLSKDTKIVKVLFGEEPKKLKEASKRLPKGLNEKYNIMFSAPVFLEFLHPSVSKGFGVKLLAENFNISQDQIICIGDAENDIHMIKYAGLGVAMGNAFPSVKKIANYITKTNEEDGVAHVINKFVLN